MTYAWSANEIAGSRRSARAIVPVVADLLPISSVLDIGCGVGAWLAAFEERGVRAIVGIDSSLSSDLLYVEPSKVRTADLRLPFDLECQFDLIMCLEVAEHLPPDSAATLVGSIAAHGDAVLFSAAVPGQGGQDHLNERWPSYWAGLFARFGFQVFDVLRPRIWHDPEVEYWYRQNLFLFGRGGVADRLHKIETNRPEILDVLHPASIDPNFGRPEVEGTGLPFDARMQRLFAGAELADPQADIPDPFSEQGGERFIQWLRTPTEGSHGLSRYIRDIYATRPDVRAAFPDLEDPTDFSGFVRWTHDCGSQEELIPSQLLPPIDPATENDATDQATENDATDQATENNATDQATENNATDQATENNATDQATENATDQASNATESEIDVLRGQIDDLWATLARLQSSKSWRWTAPARAISSAVNRIRPNSARDPSPGDGKRSD